VPLGCLAEAPRRAFAASSSRGPPAGLRRVVGRPAPAS
jgi:hypothetical protein